MVHNGQGRNCTHREINERTRPKESGRNVSGRQRDRDGEIGRPSTQGKNRCSGQGTPTKERREDNFDTSKSAIGEKREPHHTTEGENSRTTDKYPLFAPRAVTPLWPSSLIETTTTTKCGTGMSKPKQQQRRRRLLRPSAESGSSSPGKRAR